MAAQISQLQATLEDLGLQEYHSHLVEHGFDTWDNLAHITEADMATLGFKLGHRRKLQREVAGRAGYPAAEPLSGVSAPTSQVSMKTQRSEECIEDKSIRIKRRYRQRPLRDPEAPTRPDTGYIAYSRSLRQNPEVSSHSFVEIARFVGAQWSCLSREEKDIWNSEAAAQKHLYRTKLTEYCTEAYQVGRNHSGGRKQLQSPLEIQIDRTKASVVPDSCPSGPSSDSSYLFLEACDVQTNQYPTPQTNISECQTVPASYTTSPITCVDEVDTSSPSEMTGFDVFAAGGTQVGLGVPLLDNIWSIISREQELDLVAQPLQFDQEDLSPYTFHDSALLKSFHVQAINPFDLQTRATVWPLVESFLQNVNSIYYLVDPNQLWHHLNSAFDTDQDAATRIGESNNLHKITPHASQTSDQWYSEWLHIWETIRTMYRILVLGYGYGKSSAIMHNQSALYATCIAQNDINETHFPQSFRAFDELSKILSCILQEVDNRDILPPKKVAAFRQRLKKWLSCLPHELSLPTDPNTQLLDVLKMQDILSEASVEHKAKLLHLHSLYLGIMGFVTKPSLQQTVVTYSAQPQLIETEVEDDAYECLDCAFQLIALCKVLSKDPSFSVHGWLPLCVLFTSSLACTIGIIWQQEVFANDISASPKWIQQSSLGIREALFIFRQCGTQNEQTQKPILDLSIDATSYVVEDTFTITDPQSTYIYDITPTAAGLATISSDDKLRLIDPLALNKPELSIIGRQNAQFTCLRSLDEGNAIVCTGGRDGSICAFDLRSGNMVLEVKSDQNAPVLSLACLPHYGLAGGTELTNHEATVLLWDIRQPDAPQVKYAESHSDDVTELQFHPTQSSLLLSGSTDGLVNIYNTTISDEEEALHQTINLGHSISHANFLSDVDIFALSHDERLAIYSLVTDTREEVEERPPQDFGDVRERIGGDREEFDLIQFKNNPPWTAMPESKVTLRGAHGSEIHQLVFTAGEDGKVKAWRG
ncbi:hypothetical protein B7463_g9707, partial [Scytalidium lignicola]